ncbi:MAG: glycoside hydrolase domain-containing protein [Bacteroidales bacterium]
MQKITAINPVFPPNMKYQLGSPIVNEARIMIGTDKYFIIKAPDASAEKKYIKQIKLNGKKLNRTYIAHKEIMKDDLLEFVMSDAF